MPVNLFQHLRWVQHRLGWPSNPVPGFHVPGPHRHEQWQLNTLGLVQEILNHPVVGKHLCRERPLLTRYLQQLILGASATTRSDQLVSGGLMHGLWNLTSQVSTHIDLIDSAVIDVLVQFASNAR